jgi:cytochrome c-type biogenesis protein CcmH
MRACALALALLIAPLALPAAAPWTAGFALAVEPDEILDDPVLEARAREISKGLRCPVCQNESIDSSNAGLARDLRILVRERLVAGDSDQEVLDFVVARYSEFVLLQPPVKPMTYVLWFGPAVILVFGALAVAVYFARGNRAQAEAAPLSAEERKRLARLLEGEAPQGPRSPDTPAPDAPAS